MQSLSIVPRQCILSLESLCIIPYAIFSAFWLCPQWEHAKINALSRICITGMCIIGMYTVPWNIFVGIRCEMKGTERSKAKSHCRRQWRLRAGCTGSLGCLGRGYIIWQLCFNDTLFTLHTGIPLVKRSNLIRNALVASTYSHRLMDNFRYKERVPDSSDDWILRNGTRRVMFCRRAHVDIDTWSCLDKFYAWISAEHAFPNEGC